MRRFRTVQSKRYVAGVVAGIFGLWLSVAAFNFIYDPLRFMRVEGPIAKKYASSNRYLFAGLPRTYPAEFIVAGQSHSQNFLPPDIRELFGMSALNLAIPGGTAREEAAALRLALEAGRVRRVLWEVDFAALRGGPLQLHEEAHFPVELYGDGHATTLRYLSSLEVFNVGLRLIEGRGQASLDHYNTWGPEFRFGCAEVMRAANGKPSAWFEAPLSPQDTVVLDAARRSLEANFLRQVGRYPGVRFDIFLPPFASAYYQGNLRLHIALWQTLVEASERYPNLRAFNFQAWRGVVDDLSLYKDLTHFKPEINRRILEAVARNEMVMTRQSLEIAAADLAEILRSRPESCGS